jgi:hypothetical protein
MEKTEKDCPQSTPNWPLWFSMEVKNKTEAETLSRYVIRLEECLRRNMLRGDFNKSDLIDQLAIARRRFQEQAGLPVTPRWFALVYRGRILQETFAVDAYSALEKFKALRRNLPPGSTIEESNGKNRLE